jgi:dipeptidyl aminopeptidase/acylaminoacyl peptidase
MAQTPPPIVDRQLFFDDPEISGAQISPDGKFTSFLKPYNGTRNVWVKKTEEPFSAAKPITNDTKRPISQYFWSRDGKYVLFAQDKAGDENFQVYAVDPAAAPAADGVPPMRDLTKAKDARAMIYAVPRTDPDIIYIGLNDRDKAWHDLYRVRISNGERTLLRKNMDRISSWIFDNKDQLRLANRSAENGDTEILRVDADGLKKVYSCSVLEECGAVKFQKDNQRVYLITNKGNLDLIQLTLLDPQTTREELVESDPLKRVDMEDAMFSDVTDELLATVYLDDKQRINWKDSSYAADYKLLETKLPGKEIHFGAHTRDETQWIVSANSEVEPGEVYLFNRKTKSLTMQYRLREKLPREALSPMKPVRYESSDGLEIPAYLTLPKGYPEKKLPVIVLPHGGPWGRDHWAYSSLPQFLANRGYAVLQPNFRASTGYGKIFLNKGNKQWGEKMQDDITWGVKYLVQEGIADPKRVGIMGGSYGGYATLAGVTFTPDVYAGAVSIVGPSNLITLLNSIPPYWEAGRKMFFERMGDPSTPEGKAQLMRQSPLNSANKIKTPLLVVQGANDPRVNKAESDQIVVALRERKFPVQYLVAPDEGHGFARPVNTMAMFMAAEQFMARYLGGRAQEGGTPEVVARLKEISVDPNTVTLAKKVDSASVTVPKPVATPVPGTYNYEGSIQLGQQSMKISMSTTIQQEDGGWSITDSMKTPAGEAIDVSLLDKSSLILVKRTVKQGPMSMDIDFKDNKATGSMSANGQQRPISADLGGPLFADAAGAQHVVACLPLADGYTAAFRNFDIQKMQPKIMQLKVAGTESVTVPAGTFDAFKVEVTPAEGGTDKVTMWVAKDSRKPVKMAAVMPQMGGATMTAELVK